MKMLIVVFVVIILAGGGWYFFMNDTAPEAIVPSDGSRVQQPMADGAEGSIIGNSVALSIRTNESFGPYLVAYNGMTLYNFTKDTGAKSTCYGECAIDWPPYIVGPEDTVDSVRAGVNGIVGTTIRTDGKIQVTLNGHPLYFYSKDKKPGDTLGQNVDGAWFMIHMN